MGKDTNTRTPTQLRFLGHNCYLIYNDETFLLIDPWFSNKGAFFGSWFQYPKNHHLRDEIIELSKTKKGHVYFTHEHQDHFDLETLRLLDPDTTVIVPDYNDRFLSETIKKNGFQCVDLPENSSFLIGTRISINVFISEVGINRDSAIYVTTDEFTFFNQNDCKIFDRLNEIKEPITYYTVQFSGATWHPVCYTNYSEIEKAEISRRKSNSKLTNVVNAIRTLCPKFYIPAAGPAIFPYLDPTLSFGRHNIFIHQDLLNSALNSHDIHNVLYPVPGDVINESLIGQKFIPPPTPAELADYRANTVNFWEEYTPEFSITDLKKAVSDRLDKIWDLDFQCETLLQFKWGDERDQQFVIDLQAKEIIDELGVSNRNLYCLKAEKKYFALMSSNYHRWQDIYLSLRAQPYRKPDTFDNYINIFLFSDPENIREGFISSLTISDERIFKVSPNGECYEMNRYCPHQGADLSDVKINEQNEVICPRHSWRFSLDNLGKSLNSSHTICAKKVKPTPPQT